MPAVVDASTVHYPCSWPGGVRLEETAVRARGMRVVKVSTSLS